MSGRGRSVRVGGSEPSVWLPKLAAPESLKARLAQASAQIGVEQPEIRRRALRRYLESLENEEGAQGNTTQAPSASDDLSRLPTQRSPSEDE